MAGYYRIGRDLGQISGDQMISTSSSPFTGVIQGNGYSFGISVDLSVQALESYAALIKYTDGADIDYFTITNLTITGELVTNATNYTLYLASLVGSAKKTKISRITIGEVNIDIEIGNVVLTGKYSGLVSEADESIITDITIGKVSFAANYTISCDPAGISVFGGLATLISGSTSVSNVNIGEVNFESNCGFFSSSGLVSRIDDAGSSLDLARVNKFESLSGGSYGISQTNYGTISRASVGDIRPRCFYLVCDGAGISRHNYGTITKSSAFWTAPTSYAPSPNVAMSGLVTNNYGTLSNSYVWGTLRKDTATGSAAISGLIGQLGTVTNT
jgi:hypothetical protein